MRPDKIGQRLALPSGWRVRRAARTAPRGEEPWGSRLLLSRRRGSRRMHAANVRNLLLRNRAKLIEGDAQWEMLELVVVVVIDHLDDVPMVAQVSTLKHGFHLAIVDLLRLCLEIAAFEFLIDSGNGSLQQGRLLALRPPDPPLDAVREAVLPRLLVR